VTTLALLLPLGSTLLLALALLPLGSTQLSSLAFLPPLRLTRLLPWHCCLLLDRLSFCTGIAASSWIDSSSACSIAAFSWIASDSGSADNPRRTKRRKGIYLRASFGDRKLRAREPEGQCGLNSVRACHASSERCSG
jgi:hypothetical protein